MQLNEYIETDARFSLRIQRDASWTRWAPPTKIVQLLK